MSILSRHRDEPDGDQEVDGWVPLPRPVIEGAVPPLIESGGSMSLVGYPPLWAILADGTGLGAAHRLMGGRYEADEIIVINVGRPPAGMTQEAYIRAQLGEIRVSLRAGLTRAKVMRLGGPVPVPVEPPLPPPPAPVRGLEFGRPVDDSLRRTLRTRTLSVAQESHPRTVRVVNEDPDNKMGEGVVPPSPRVGEVAIREYPWTWVAYNPSGAVCGISGAFPRDRWPSLILWPSHLPMEDGDIDRIRVTPEGKYVWCLWPGESTRNWPGWQTKLTFVQVES